MLVDQGEQAPSVSSFGFKMSEIYPLADKFDLSSRLKQNGKGKNRMKTQMVLLGYNTKKFIYSKVAYAGVTIFLKA